jgi:uncharacterized protein YjbI with pentapeptide repeats
VSADIFISHSSRDRDMAQTLCDALEVRGFGCWMAERDVGPGENFQVAIYRAIRTAKAMVLVFSGHANNSDEIKKELVLASQSRLVVIPVRIEDVVPDEGFAYELAIRQWIDLFADWEGALQRLARQLEGITGVERDLSPDRPVKGQTAQAGANIYRQNHVRRGADSRHVFNGPGVRIIGLALAAAVLLGLAGLALLRPGSDAGSSKSQPSNSELLQKVVVRSNLAEAQNAVTELSRRCGSTCTDRETITKAFVGALRTTGHIERELNLELIAALNTLTDYDLHQVLANQLAKSKAELVEVDFSGANLRGVNFSDLFMIVSNFRNTDLTGADLSDTLLRGSDFKGATLTKTAMESADWFNTFNIEKPQFEQLSGSVLQCPQSYADLSFKPFMDAVNSRYGISYENYSHSHQQELKEQWRKYGAPGGLCELAERRP